jgi:hypothetical protein
MCLSDCTLRPLDGFCHGTVRGVDILRALGSSKNVWRSIGRTSLWWKMDAAKNRLSNSEHASSLSVRSMPSGARIWGWRWGITQRSNLSHNTIQSWSLWTNTAITKLEKITRIYLYNGLLSSIYTGCPRRNVPNFGIVFLVLKYTDITQNTYIQSWKVTEKITREKWGLLAVPNTATRIADRHVTEPMSLRLKCRIELCAWV